MQMDRLLARVEEAHVRFRKAIKQAVTEAGQASDLWDDLLETQAFEGEQDEEGAQENPNVGRTFSMAQSTRSMVSLWCSESESSGVTCQTCGGHGRLQAPWLM